MQILDIQILLDAGGWNEGGVSITVSVIAIATSDTGGWNEGGVSITVSVIAIAVVTACGPTASHFRQSPGIEEHCCIGSVAKK